MPYNPEFARGLTSQGGVVSRPGEPAIRTTGFVVNPVIKTQYTDSWFTNPSAGSVSTGCWRSATSGLAA